MTPLPKTLLLVTLLIRPAFAESPIAPDPVKTPGAVMSTDADVICVPGYSKKARDVPQTVKEQTYRNYGIYSRKPNEYEVDHLISLELGGANTINNLWPESFVTQPLNAHVKDELENKLHTLICSHQLDVKQAQQEIAHNWIAAYEKYVGPLPNGDKESALPVEQKKEHENTELHDSVLASHPDDSGNCPDTAPIKVSKSGIYHVQNEANYKATKARKCFASAVDAETAGFRAPR